MAEDGQIYESAAIEAYFKTQTAKDCTSPMTREKIGKKMVPARQHKHTIEMLVNGGTISGDLAVSWKAKEQQEKAIKVLTAEAEKGDVKSMERLASSYYERGHFKKAFQWFKRAQFAGSVSALAEMGDMLVLGEGVKRNKAVGLVYLGTAAGKGCDLGAYALGLYFASGEHGLPVDRDKAIEYPQASLEDCQHACMNDEAKSNAKEELEKVLSVPEQPTQDDSLLIVLSSDDENDDESNAHDSDPSVHPESSSDEDDDVSEF